MNRVDVVNWYPEYARVKSGGNIYCVWGWSDNTYIIWEHVGGDFSGHWKGTYSSMEKAMEEFWRMVEDARVIAAVTKKLTQTNQ